MSVKVGDRVLIGVYRGHIVDIDGVDHKIMREKEVLAIIE
jgi:co-chaperonin GroES (HSP10)